VLYQMLLMCLYGEYIGFVRCFYYLIFFHSLLDVISINPAGSSSTPSYHHVVALLKQKFVEPKLQGGRINGCGFMLLG
jgi:hypothetical protein